MSGGRAGSEPAKLESLITQLRIPAALVATALIIGSYAVPTALAAPATQMFTATADAQLLENSPTTN